MPWKFGEMVYLFWLVSLQWFLSVCIAAFHDDVGFLSSEEQEEESKKTRKTYLGPYGER